jgi:hypothetical protein
MRARGSPPVAAGLAAVAVQLPIAAHWLSLLDEVTCSPSPTT